MLFGSQIAILGGGSLVGAWSEGRCSPGPLTHYFVFFLLVAAVILVRARSKGHAQLGTRKLPLRTLVLETTLGLALCLGVVIQLGLIDTAFRGTLVSPGLQHPMVQLLVDDDSRLILLLLVCFGACVEELLFRGHLRTQLLGHGSETCTRPWVVAWTHLGLAVIFGLMHPISVTYISTATALGLVFAYLRERSLSLWVPMFVHLLWNAGVALVAILR